ncbi:hypothetical protein [Paenibacillus taichungensis]
MKFNAWYRINYGFFMKIRFQGVLKSITPTALETEDWGANGDIVTTTRYSINEMIHDYFSSIPADEIVSYSFEINNGILRERLSFNGSIRRPYVNVKSILNPLTQDVFLRNIFKSFGVYLAVYIKEHQFALTGQEYILNEYQMMLEKHTPYTTGCGDYSFIHDRSKASTEDFLGAEADLEQNPSIALDSRKGITLVLYRNLIEKDHFIVDEHTVDTFDSLTNNDARLCNWALVPLLKENIPYDLLYSFTSDYPEQPV